MASTGRHVWRWGRHERFDHAFRGAMAIGQIPARILRVTAVALLCGKGWEIVSAFWLGTLRTIGDDRLQALATDPVCCLPYKD